jgi:hypothetical protein
MSGVFEAYKGYTIIVTETDIGAWVGSVPALQRATMAFSTSEAALTECRIFIDYVGAQRSQSMSPVVPIGATLGLVLLGVVQDAKAHTDDHTVPRVPVTMAGSMATTTVTISSGMVYVSNYLNGDEYRLPPTDRPKPTES